MCAPLDFQKPCCQPLRLDLTPIARLSNSVQAFEGTIFLSTSDVNPPPRVLQSLELTALQLYYKVHMMFRRDLARVSKWGGQRARLGGCTVFQSLVPTSCDPAVQGQNTVSFSKDKKSVTRPPVSS